MKYPKYEDILNVKLISYSQPIQYDPLWVGRESVSGLISYCARVSNPANQGNLETADKLIKYLLDHKHFSPFEQVFATVEITTTRDIARQLLRHRSCYFQEFSGRYASNADELGFCTREARAQDWKNRQNSLEIEDLSLDMGWRLQQEIIIDRALETYKWAIANGIAKEQARAVLPEGNTVSKLYLSAPIRSYLHYLEVRRDGEGVQKEHRLMAIEIGKAIAEIFPYVG